jgi:cyclic pyranopterin phosphate synthase
MPKKQAVSFLLYEIELLWGVQMRDMRIVLTNKCNLNCSYCYNEGNPKEETEHEIQLGMIQRVLEALRKEIREIVLTGGEPLLYTNLESLIKYGSSPFSVNVI